MRAAFFTVINLYTRWQRRRQNIEEREDYLQCIIYKRRRKQERRLLDLGKLPGMEKKVRLAFNSGVRYCAAKAMTVMEKRGRGAAAKI